MSSRPKKLAPRPSDSDFIPRHELLQPLFGTHFASPPTGALLEALTAPKHVRYLLAALPDFCEPQNRLEALLQRLHHSGYRPQNLVVDAGAYCPEDAEEVRKALMSAACACRTSVEELVHPLFQ